LVAVPLIFYLKGNSRSTFARLLNNSDYGVVVLTWVLSIPLIVHLPSEIFWFFILSLFLLPVVFYPR
jgi:hypothetical protein